VRRSFYAALRDYAPFAYDELRRAAEEAPESGFPFSFGEHVEQWCHCYRFYAAAADRQIPEWFELDAIDSYFRWDRANAPFALRAFWRDQTEPPVISVGMTEAGPDSAVLQLTESHPDSAELQVLLRISLVRTETDESGATVPAVISLSAGMQELVERFKTFVEPEFSGLLVAAAQRGMARPNPGPLDAAMRRFVLKQFRLLDSLDIAAGEARGDPGCSAESTDAERAVMEEQRTQRRDVDDAIKYAGDKLRVPARSFPTGRKPTRSLADRRG
jgi:hypothetical protein